MIDIDWSWFTPVSVWQTVVTISILVVAIYVITRMLMRFWPRLRKVITLFDALGELPRFMVEVQKFMPTVLLYMTDNNKAMDEVHRELTTNNGTSLNDAVRRVEISVEEVRSGVDGLHKKVDEQKLALEAEDAKIRQEIEKTKPRAEVIPPKRTRTKKELP